MCSLFAKPEILLIDEQIRDIQYNYVRIRHRLLCINYTSEYVFSELYSMHLMQNKRKLELNIYDHLTAFLQLFNQHPDRLLRPFPNISNSVLSSNWVWFNSHMIQLVTVIKHRAHFVSNILQCIQN